MPTLAMQELAERGILQQGFLGKVPLPPTEGLVLAWQTAALVGQSFPARLAFAKEEEPVDPGRLKKSRTRMKRLNELSSRELLPLSTAALVVAECTMHRTSILAWSGRERVIPSARCFMPQDLILEDDPAGLNAENGSYISVWCLGEAKAC